MSNLTPRQGSELQQIIEITEQELRNANEPNFVKRDVLRARSSGQALRVQFSQAPIQPQRIRERLPGQQGSA